MTRVRAACVSIRREIGFIRGEVLVFTAVRVVGVGVAAVAGTNGRQFGVLFLFIFGAPRWKARGTSLHSPSTRNTLTPPLPPSTRCRAHLRQLPKCGAIYGGHTQLPYPDAVHLACFSCRPQPPSPNPKTLFATNPNISPKPPYPKPPNQT